MGAKSKEFAVAALPVVEERLSRLRTFTFEQARQLPEVETHDWSIAGFKASVTVFRQDNAFNLSGRTLVVALAARPAMFGVAAQHVQHGLVFSPDEPVRDATALELQNSGGLGALARC